MIKISEGTHATGASAGAIGGAVSGAISAAFADEGSSLGDVATTSAVSGGISGVLGPAGKAVGHIVGRGGTAPLTHYTSEAAAKSIDATKTLGTSATSNLYATTGAAVGTGVGGRGATEGAVQITGKAAELFKGVRTGGLVTGFRSGAGTMVGPAGQIHLGTGAIISGGGPNTGEVWFKVLDRAFDVAIGFICGLEGHK